MAPSSPARLRIVQGGVVAAVCAIVIGGGAVLFREDDPIARISTAAASLSSSLPMQVAGLTAPASQPAVASSPDTAPSAARAELPTFDVVRVSPSGSTVLAGRAVPGADVTVSDGGQELGRTQADQRGDWVMVPGAPLQPGGRELSLASRGPSGVELKGDAPVLLVVPERNAPPAQAVPLAVVVPQAAAPRLLLAPPPEPALAAAPSVPPALPGRSGGRLGLDVVDYGDAGDIRLGGSAAPGAPVRVYVDNTAIGDTKADPQGRWIMTPREAMLPGVHQVRIDQLTNQGKVAARVELPVQRDLLPAGAVPDGRVVVQPGQNLWRLARHSYGSGVRYTIIYQANREHIRDPRLIYPGQAFTLPAL